MRKNAELERRFKVISLLVIRIEEELGEEVSETFYETLDLVGTMIENNDLRKAEEGIFRIESLVIDFFEMAMEKD